MAFSANEGEGGGFTEPNVVPLVDVMLVLLIIFMVTAPLMNHKVQIVLPEAALQQRPEVPPQIITLSIKETGEIFWNDQPVTRELLETQLAVEAQKTPQPQVDIRADRMTRYAIVQSVMKTAKDVGIRKIGFVATPSS